MERPSVCPRSVVKQLATSHHCTACVSPTLVFSHAICILLCFYHHALGIHMQCAYLDRIVNEPRGPIARVLLGCLSGILPEFGRASESLPGLNEFPDHFPSSSRVVVQIHSCSSYSCRDMSNAMLQSFSKIHLCSGCPESPPMAILGANEIQVCEAL